MSELDGLDLTRVIRELIAIKGAGGRTALAIRKAEAARAQAVRDYEAECAVVRCNTVGSVQAKTDAALTDMKCQRLRKEMDVAKEAENYAKRLATAYEQDQSNLQTQARLIESTLKLAGVAG
jgi:Holliday junction resolvasome RuvABC DNA-binding subunit